MDTSPPAGSDAELHIAWALFSRLHDQPSSAHASRLVRWLGEDPRHVRALDDVLTLWALAGASGQQRRDGGRLQ